MLILALLPLLAGGLVAAVPNPGPGAAPAITCSTDVPSKFLHDGVPQALAPGTACKMENGVAVVGYATEPVAAGTSPEAGTPASDVGTPTPSTTAAGEAPAADNPGSLPSTGFSQQADRPQLVHKVPIGISPSGTATCSMAGGVPVMPTVTAKAPAPTFTSDNKDGKRFVAYWSVWAGTGKGELPTAAHLKGVTHLILAFWDPNTLNGFAASANNEWGTDIGSKLKAVRKAANPSDKNDMRVMVAFGGWALDEVFRFNATDENRGSFAQMFVNFLEMYDLDGVDVDWEYPVDNGNTYLTSRPNSPCDKPNNILLMQELRNRLDTLTTKTKKTYALSLAVPALHTDMMAYDEATVREIDKVVDFWNLMSYDAVNRRSKVTAHHAGGGVIKQTIDNYVYGGKGVDPKKLNIGFPMYAKFFNFKSGTTDCTATKTIGCSMGTGTFEGANAEDMGTSGAILFNKALMDTALANEAGAKAFEKLGVYKGWDNVKAKGVSDPVALATSAYDEASKTWFTWLTAADTKSSCEKYLGEVGGVMAWSIDQDDRMGDGGEQFDALQQCLQAK